METGRSSKGAGVCICIAYIKNSGDHTAGSFWAPASGIVYVLFVPVRYQISGSWKEEKWGGLRVSWLLFG